MEVDNHLFNATRSKGIATNGAPGIATRSDRTLRTGLLALLLVTRSNSYCGACAPVPIISIRCAEIRTEGPHLSICTSHEVMIAETNGMSSTFCQKRSKGFYLRKRWILQSVKRETF